MPVAVVQVECFPQARLSGLKSTLQLSDSGLALGWLLDTLWQRCLEFRKALGPGEVVEVESKDISDGKGFASKVYKVALTLANASDGSFTVMMKVPTTEGIERIMQAVPDAFANLSEEVADVSDYHNAECRAYDLLCKLDCIPLPKIWHTQAASDSAIGVILMNDLAVDSVNLGSMASLSLRQIKNTVAQFVLLHKRLLCLDNEMKAQLEAIPAHTNFNWEGNAHFVGASIAGVDEYKDGEFKEMLEKVKPAMTDDFARYALREWPKQNGMPSLLCQGDAGAHNMFFKKAADGTASSEPSAFIDWQIVFVGNQMFDIARLVYLNCDAEVRREAEETLVEDYYALLRQEMEKEGRQLDLDIEQVRKAYALASVHQALFMTGSPQMINVKKDELSPAVFEAFREKSLLNVKLALRDAIQTLRKYAPEFLAS